MEVLRAVACKRCKHWRVLVRWLLQVGVVVVVVVVFVVVGAFVVFVVVVVGGGGVLVRWLLHIFRYFRISAYSVNVFFVHIYVMLYMLWFAM